MLTLAILLDHIHLPWFMDLTFQVPMQYCYLQHWTLLPSPVTSTTGHCFCFDTLSSFFLELFLHSSPVACWAPTDLAIMVTSFKRSHAYTATLSAPDSVAGHSWPTLLPETPGHSQASLSQSLVGSVLISPGSWCTQDLFVPSKSLFPQSCVSSGGSMGLRMTSSKRAYATLWCG